MSDFKRANEALRKKDYLTAIKYYKKYRIKNEGSLSCLENLGFSYVKLGEFENAKPCFEEVLALNEKSPIAKHFFSKVYIKDTAKKEELLYLFDASHPVSIMKSACRFDNKEDLIKQSLHIKNRENDFVLYRVIGNDLFPRHEIGQTRRNVEYILKHEPSLKNCRKIWILNRIVDLDEKNKLVNMLEKYGQEFLEIPFLDEEYKNVDFDMTMLPEDFLESNSFQKKGQGTKERVLTTIYRQKNNYAMNNNGARNFALNHGRDFTDAKWILPWDGNCYITEKAWRDITSDIISQEYFKYFAVPMERVSSNEVLFDADYQPDPREEPQIIFRCDTTENFNEEFSYGRRPKVEMLWRLGIPGLWDDYKDDPWDPKRRPLSQEAGMFGVAGWTARLFSGMGNQEKQNKEGARSRFSARQQAIVSMLDFLDKKFLSTSNLDSKLISTKKNMLGFSSEEPLLKIKSQLRTNNIFIFVNRNDGLGERLKAILNGLMLSDIFGVDFKFYWPENVSVGAEFHAIEKVDEIFSKEFIEKHVCELNELPKKLISIDAFDFEEIKGVSNYECILCDQRNLVPILKSKLGLDIRGVDKYFKKLKFSTKTQLVVDKAFQIPLKSDCCAVHLRGGDIIYGRYRFSERYQKKAVPFSLAKQLIQDLICKGLQPLVFYQDQELEKYIQDLDSVIVARSLVSNINQTPLEQALFEITLMSRCSTIFAGTSGFAGVASRIAGINPVQIPSRFSNEEIADIISRDLRENDYGNYQNAYGWLMYVIYGEGVLEKKELLYGIQRAINEEPDNGLYLAKRIIISLMYEDNYKADIFLKEELKGEAYLSLRHNAVLQAVLSKKSSGFVYQRFFDVFLKKEYSDYFYVSFLKAYVAKNIEIKGYEIFIESCGQLAVTNEQKEAALGLKANYH